MIRDLGASLAVLGMIVFWLVACTVGTVAVLFGVWACWQALTAIF